MARRRRQVGGLNDRGSQQSIYYPYSESFWSGFRKREFALPKMYEHMFMQDVQNSIFPWRRHGENWISINTKDDHNEMIACALDDHYSELKEAVSRFAREGLIYSLLTYRKAYYEIAYYEDGSFRFVPVLNHTIIRLPGIFFQYVPKRLREYKQDGNNRFPMFIRLKPSNMFCISAPKHLRRTLKKVMKGLVYLSDNDSMPKFASKQMLSDGGMYPLDYSEYRRTTARYLATLTKELGWSGRQSFKDEELEYYSWLRFLRFEQFKHDLREAVIYGINKGLRTVKKNWEPIPQLTQNVFPQHGDFISSMESLRTGSLKFSDIFKPYLRY